MFCVILFSVAALEHLQKQIIIQLSFAFLRLYIMQCSSRADTTHEKQNSYNSAREEREQRQGVFTRVYM